MFPADIKGCMKDCMLALFWPRQHIMNFFKDHGCTGADLRHVVDFKDKSLSRAKIVDAVFSRLSSRADNGVGPFKAMEHALINWAYFDPFWFDTTKKLDRKEADRKIAHLRKVQEARNEKSRGYVKRRQQDEAEKQRPTKTLIALREKFIRLHSGETTPQRRGYDLQDILLELAKLAGLETTEPFMVRSEQIDGAVKYDGEHYLVEAKWQDAAASNEPLYQLAGKVDGKMYGRGIFISVNGYSTHVVTDLTFGKALHIILVDGEDLILVLESHIGFVEMIDLKVKAAQTKGNIYIHPISQQSKVKPCTGNCRKQ